MRMGWFLCGLVVFLFGCGDGGGTAGDANDPATTSDAAAMTETDENAAKPPEDGESVPSE